MQIRGITTPLLFLLKINFSSRILLTGMLLSLLWFLIYYNAKEYFLHPFYFILPSLLIVLILVALPSLLTRGFVNHKMDNNYSSDDNNNGSSSSSNILEGIDASNMQVEEVKLSQQGSDYTIEGNTAISNEGVVDASTKSVTIDESMIQQMVDEKITSIVSSVGEAVQKASDAINVVNTVKTDIENLKKSMKDLTEAFETTLVDFKAFQAEIANPLNFMRKYFDQLNIDSLSDPTLPLQKSDINLNGNNNGKHGNDGIADRNASNNNNNSDDSNEQTHIKKQEKEGIVTINKSKESNITDTSIKETSRDDTNIVSNEGILSLAYVNGITLAMLMELILTIGEFMKKFGNEYANILYMQCKLLNLSNEAEKIVYSIVDMLGKSTLTPEECAISLYMLADVLDIKDKDADTLYARLRMSIKSSQIDSKGIGVDEHEHR
ncbi:MAG: hypothetical protein ACK4FV_06415 [Candidatus Nitrosocaldus sp.]